MPFCKNTRKYLGFWEKIANREGLDKTPERVAKAMQFFTQGYELDAHAISGFCEISRTHE